MPNYTTNEFKPGLKLMIDGAPCSILENQFVKPGKGQAFNRVRLRNLKTGRVWDRTFKSGESVAAADVVELAMNFLYREGQHWHFMDSISYEQYSADESVMEEARKWLSEQDQCSITLWNGVPIQVKAPNFVDLKITETDPGVRGDTVTGGSKSALLSTGSTIKVPLFLEKGDIIRIDTRIGEYQSRVR